MTTDILFDCGRRIKVGRITGMRTALLTLVTMTILATAPVSAAPSAALAAAPSAVVRSAPSPTALTQVSSDPFTNSGSSHATEVEPDTYAVGSTIVGAFQVGRTFTGGSSDTGWVTSLDAGRHWIRGFLPDTVNSHGRYPRISDPVVGYDSKHRTWLISGISVSASAIGTGVVVNRSTDALHWSSPITVFAVAPGGFADKDWITCDNTPSSRHYGNCYEQFDLPSAGDLLEMSVSTNGGRTWSPPKPTADREHGLAGQPLVQPNGTVVVPYFGFGYIGSFVSANGGASWSAHHVVSAMDRTLDAGSIRSDGLPSAQEDAAGKVYVVWEDCRFRSRCQSNDIVLSTSTNGTKWTPVVRIPIGNVTDAADHMIPGIGIQPGTSGSTAKIAIYYYYYPTNACDLQTCRLDVGFISSVNGGKTWSAPIQVGTATLLGRIVPTSSGRMVGDYIGTAIVSGRAFALFAVGLPAVGHNNFNEPMVVVPGGEPITGGPHPVQPAVNPPMPSRAGRVTGKILAAEALAHISG
jgi:hypothetical protein